MSKSLSVGLGLALLGLAGVGAASAQTATESVVVVHAGSLLDRPGRAARGASTIVIRNGRIEAVRDGFVSDVAGASVIDLRDLLYFALMIAFWLMATGIVLDIKKAN